MGIRLADVRKEYDSETNRRPALAGIDLEIETGEFAAVVGTSGSGKTTLLNIVGGLDRDYTGDVEVDGRNLASLDERQIAELRNRSFGFIFQHFNLLDHLTVRENVTLPSFFSPKSTADPPAARAEELLERVGLASYVDAHPNHLSGGQRQRVAIARALFGDPTHLLCDEPTGNLDRQTGLQIMEMFQEMNRREDRTLLLVTHEEHIARMSRRIVRLEDGRIHSDEPNEPVEPDASSVVETAGAVDAD